MADTDKEAEDAPGRAFLSDGKELTPIEQLPWDSGRLRAALSVALAHESFITEGAFAIVHGRARGAYAGRRLGGIGPYTPVVLKVIRSDGRWIAVGPAGTGPREVFHDGRSQPWDGPVPVEALD
jgi:hypothetical protein